MHTELHRKLEASIRRTKRNFLIVVGTLVVLLLMIGAAIFTDPERTLGTQIFLSLFGVGVFFLMLKIAQLALKPSLLLKLLETDPKQIKKVEVMSIVYPHGRPTRQMNLHFHITGEKTQILSDKRSAIQELLPLLKTELPHAEFKEVSSNSLRD